MSRTDEILDDIARRSVGAAGGERHGASDPETLLQQIAEIGQTARTSWFALLALLAFVGVTMMAHTDAAFFARGVATPLPVVGIEVPTVAFFIAAPLLMAALYAHLQLYLVSLWDAIGDAPARIGPDRLIDRVAPTVIAQSAVLHRSRTRRDGSAPVRAFAGAMEAITVLLVWLATPALIAWMFWRSMPLHSPWLTLWIGACLVAAVLFGLEGLRIARGRLSRPRKHRDAVHARWGWGRNISAAAFAAFVALLSWETTQGLLMPYWLRSLTPLRASADLREAKLTPRPDDWKPFDLWLADHRKESGGEPEADTSPTEAEMTRWRLVIQSLEAPNLKARDLRSADAAGAFLPGADLREAQLWGADLSGARMEGARFGWARMKAADLSEARLEGADLRYAQMEWANLSGARMDGADLSSAWVHRVTLRKARMMGANLGGATLEGSDLRGARLEGADLRGARMEGADLRGARMAGADLRGADLEGADLRDAQMQRADLRGTKFRNALLDRADLRDARCGSLWGLARRDTSFHGSVLDGAVLLCQELQQDALNNAIGDEATTLPDGLVVERCFQTPPGNVEKMIDRYFEDKDPFAEPALFDTRIRSRLLCK